MNASVVMSPRNTNTAFEPQQEARWRHVEYAIWTAKPLALLSTVFAITVLSGYLFSVERLYRPFVDGPATNPLTALCILLTALSILIATLKNAPFWGKKTLVLIVIALSAGRLIDASGIASIVHLITPFYDLVIQERLSGKNNAMGVNSAILFLAISSSLALYFLGYLIAAQAVASVSVAIPVISFVGYFYGLDQFHGQMSLITATAGTTLALAAVSLTADHGGLRAILSPYIGGIIARRQFVASLVFPVVLGYVLIHTTGPNSSSLFGFFVVALAWFTIVIVSASAVYQENIDSQRRFLEKELEKAAYIDPLTGLWNRRKLFEFGKSETARLARKPGEYWFLMIDIDRFKNINDTAGHDIGDLVLITLADTLKSNIRSIDLASRMGGEEFAVVLLDCNKEGAERVAEEIRRGIENMVVDGWSAEHGAITASIGCAGNRGVKTFEEVIKMADESMYQAKSNGRNQVIVHPLQMH